MKSTPLSLLAHLAHVPDPRRPHGRRYPLAAMLGFVVLGALHAQSSLRGIWVWAGQHWAELWQPLGLRHARFPALTTLWNVTMRLDQTAVERALATWLEQLAGHPLGGMSADGKVLRGSRRDTQTGVLLVSMVQHQRGMVLGQARVTGGRWRNRRIIGTPPCRSSSRTCADARCRVAPARPNAGCATPGWRLPRRRQTQPPRDQGSCC